MLVGLPAIGHRVIKSREMEDKKRKESGERRRRAVHGAA